MSASFIFCQLHRTTVIDYIKRFLKDKLVNREISKNYVINELNAQAS